MIRHPIRRACHCLCLSQASAALLEEWIVVSYWRAQPGASKAVRRVHGADLFGFLIGDLFQTDFLDFVARNGVKTLIDL